MIMSEIQIVKNQRTTSKAGGALITKRSRCDSCNVGDLCCIVNPLSNACENA